jgi:hypothetical protein
MVARDSACTEFPKLCTGLAMMYGYATTLTYLCPETTQKPSTVHVTVTKTITVTPPEVEITLSPTETHLMYVPAC